jgi:hypothetical protein
MAHEKSNKISKHPDVLEGEDSLSMIKLCVRTVVEYSPVWTKPWIQCLAAPPYYHSQKLKTLHKCSDQGILEKQGLDNL